MKNQNYEIPENLEWETGTRAKKLTHDIHPSFAQFDPSLPRIFIEKLTDSGEKVLDPFCGTGAALLEAILLRRKAVGVDRNPLACLVSKVKCTPLTSSQIRCVNKVKNRISEHIHQITGQKTLSSNSSYPEIEYDVPDFNTKKDWFQDWVKKELAIIKTHIRKDTPKVAKNLSNEEVEEVKRLLKVAFSSIVNKVSNQQSESVYRWVEREVRKGEVLKYFLDKLKDIISKNKQLRKEINHDKSVKVYAQDTRQLSLSEEDKKVDLIVTSPPYLNAWDYGLYNKFRMKWLGYNVQDFNKDEIGKHLRANKDGEEEIRRYKADMKKCIGNFFEVLKPNKYFCLVNANAVVDGELINTNRIIAKSAEKTGFTLIKAFEQELKGPHFGNRASLKTKEIFFDDKRVESKEKKETILLFKKQLH